jgi:hypothetical protein
MNERSNPDRREILRRVALRGAALAVAGTASRLAAEEKAGEKEEGVAPADDLMREHGVLVIELLAERGVLVGGDDPADRRKEHRVFARFGPRPAEIPSRARGRAR